MKLRNLYFILEFIFSGSISATPSSALSEKDETEELEDVELEDLQRKVKQLAVRPIDGVEGCSDNKWESELNTTVNKLDHMLLMKECVEQLNQYKETIDKSTQNEKSFALPENNCDNLKTTVE